MSKLAAAALSLLGIVPLFADLSPDQKAADFRALVDTYAKYYAPYEWKRDGLKVDALAIRPWLDRIARSQNDLEYYDILVEYIGSLNDAHDAFFLPSTFRATLGFGVDLYDGKALIDAIERNRLPVADYSFEIGDELVSMDGRTPAELIRSLEKYAVSANPLSTRRTAASMITVRSQWFMPRAHELGESAEIVVRRASGESATYKIPWRKTGIAVTSLTPPAPIRTAASQELRGHERLFRAQNFVVPEKQFIVGMGVREPVFQLPEGTDVRIGRNRSDALFSAIIKSGDYKIGYIRIPGFSSFSRANEQMQNEIAFMQQNTDGLVVDVMRNPGGSGCAAESLLRNLFTQDFTLLGAEQNVTWSDILTLTDDIQFYQELNFPDEDIAELRLMLNEFESAYRNNRARTRPMPLCGTTLDAKAAVDAEGKPIGYGKPMLLLVDEMTYSAAEIFAAVIQDNQRAKLFGRRTVGAGGSVGTVSGGIYSEGSASLTFSLLNRRGPISNPDLPAAPYIENIGVRPEIEKDYMTRDNLMNKGKDFVDAFLVAIVNEIKAKQ